MNESAAEIEIKRERYADFIDDVKALLPSHWKELALYQDDIPLAPDYDFYRRADFSGMLVFMAMRTKQERLLVGYAVYFIKAHHHYIGHRWAVSDIFWLHPDYRNLGFGRALFEAVEVQLKELGVDVVHCTLKTAQPAAGFVLEKLGFSKVEVGYSKLIGTK